MIRRGSVGRAAIGCAVLGLAACTGTAGPASSSLASGDELTRASSGVCDALASLATNREAAVRSFQNEAHDALHALAAVDGLDRATAAQVLETMGRVEYDIGAAVPAEGLRPDLAALLAAADSALSAIGIDPPACTSQ